MLTSAENIAKYYLSLAKKHNLNLLTRNDFEINSELFDQKDYFNYLKLQAIPIKKAKNRVVVATANPTEKNIKKIDDYFTKKFRMPIKISVISRQDISYVLSQRFSKKLAHDITNKRFDIDPVHSASYTFSLTQKIVLIVIIMLFIAALSWFFLMGTFIVTLILSMGTVVVMAYKMGLTLRLTRWPQKKTVVVTEFDIDPPTYTILIPMLREKKVTISALLASIERIDYEKSKLDVKLLVEEDDLGTIEIINLFRLPWYFDVLIVPPGLPRSKPRACNYGLYLAFGEYLTIFDAEDRPDPDQLKQALKCFGENDQKTVCIQAALNFYNYKENLLTKLFTIEFSHWFDFFIPALVFLKAPVPLGGTSNHFKKSALLKLGGWDPYIGTEDADIGIRIYRHGLKTNCITSTTYEEANSNLRNWFLQRVRWNKGYMQTYLVNMRDPIKMIKEIGIIKFINFQYFVGGNVFIQLANFPLWVFLIAMYFHLKIVGLAPNPKILFYTSWYNFLIANGILLISEFYSVYKRRLYCLLPYVPLKLFYWLLMSIAGYYAVFELLIRPGYWYKTEHGFSKQGNNTDIPIH